MTLAALLCLSAGAASLDPGKTINQFSHTAWTAKDGIPGPVQAIAQTNDGYLWLGTSSGLYRYDGALFEANASGEELARKPVLALLAARDGSLWIGFASGLIGRIQSGVLTTFSTGDALHRGVVSFAEGPDGRVWASGESGLQRFENDKWANVSEFPTPGAQCVAFDRDGTLWVATNGKDFELGGGKIRVNTILKLLPGARMFQPTGEPVGEILQLQEAPDRSMWMVHPNERSVGGIFHKLSRTVIPDPNDGPTSLVFDGRSVWIGLFHSGLRRVAEFNDLNKAGTDSFGEKDGLSSNNVLTLFQDREGNVWVGTSKGVDRFHENKVTPLGRKQGVDPTNSISLATDPDGTVWFASFADPFIWHVAAGRTVRGVPFPGIPEDSNRILSLYSGKDRLWLGGGLGLASITNGRSSLVHIPGFDSRDAVEAIAEDLRGDLWTVIWRQNRSRLKWFHSGRWTDFPGWPPFPGDHCRLAFADRDGRVWFGCESGEAVVIENGAARIYESSAGLPRGRIFAIEEDRSGHIWIGGEGGASRLDGDRFRNVTKQNGMPQDLVSAIAEDDHGSFWIAGSLGIIRVAKHELERALAQPSYRMQTLLLDTRDGLPGQPTARWGFAMTKTSDGRLWFATTDGIGVVDPQRLPMNFSVPPVVIESVKGDDRGFPVSPRVRFGAKTRNIEISFAALSFSVPERVRYRYKLDGYDGEWRGPLISRLASYTNLPPGDYRFQVIASNDDSVWNQTGATVAFSIAPAFYQTYPFVFSCVVVAAVLMLAAVRWRVRLAETRLAAQFQQRLGERTRIAQDLHDTLLQGVISASLQLSVANRELAPGSKPKAIVSEVLELMKTAIEDGRKAVFGMRVTQADSTDLVKSLSRIGTEEIADRAPTFRVFIEGSERTLHALVRDDVYRISREAIINAFRHAEARRVEVELRYGYHQLSVFVRDDGRGIAPDVLRYGRVGHWGLSGMREAADRIGATLHIRSRRGEGTELELIVPGNLAFTVSSRSASSGWKRILQLGNRSKERDGNNL